MTNSHPHWGLGWVPPRDVSPPSDDNALAAFDVAFGMVHKGQTPWGWQRESAAAITSMIDDVPMYGSFALMAQRQEGKTAQTEALNTMWLMGQMRVAYAWHERKLGRIRLLRLGDKLEEELGDDVNVIRTNGYESISLEDGRIDLMTATDAGARGDSYDIVLVDEALEATVDFVAAVQPTMSTSPFEQMIYVSSAGKSKSVALRDAYDLALADIEAGKCEPGMFGCYALGATEEQAEHPYNQKMWQAIMPTLGLEGGVKLQSVIADTRRMGRAEFMRERLGIWTDDDDEHVMTDEQIDAILGDEYEPDYELR